MQPMNAPQFVSQAMFRQFATDFLEAITSTRQRVFAIEARMKLAEQGRTPRFPIEFRSQFGEDLWVWDVLGGQTSGFFIEVGAFDGVSYSVTYALEAMGWNGLLIEAIPAKFEKCRARRPHSRVVHAALGKKASSGTVEFNHIVDQFGGMLSHVGNSVPAPGQPAHKTEKIKVPFTSIDELLKDHSGPIDLAVIDVEGSELDVLDGFDLKKHKPRLLILEENTGGRDPRLMNYMKTQPYTFAGLLAADQLWIRTDEAHLLQRTRRVET